MFCEFQPVEPPKSILGRDHASVAESMAFAETCQHGCPKATHPGMCAIVIFWMLVAVSALCHWLETTCCQQTNIGELALHIGRTTPSAHHPPSIGDCHGMRFYTTGMTVCVLPATAPFAKLVRNMPQTSLDVCSSCELGAIQLMGQTRSGMAPSGRPRNSWGSRLDAFARMGWEGWRDHAKNANSWGNHFAAPLELYSNDVRVHNVSSL